MPSSRSSTPELASRHLAKAEAEVARLRGEQAVAVREFETARTRLHDVNARLVGARCTRQKWVDALDRARCPRIGKVEA